MKAINSEILCCPKCKAGLQISSHSAVPSELQGLWECTQCGRTFKSDNGFIYFIGRDEVFRFSRRAELFRTFYARFYTPLTNLMFLPCGGASNARKEVLENLEISPGSVILETGIGTGDNVDFLNGRLDGCTYYGLDNQLRMLRKCAQNAIPGKRTLKLCLANAEELPFKENSFDVVYQFGAFNLFQDKQHALDEMIRVAKPGSRIVIADETEKATRLFAIFTGHQESADPPIGMIPGNMLEICLKTIWNGYGWLVSFRKPK